MILRATFCIAMNLNISTAADAAAICAAEAKAHQLRRSSARWNIFGTYVVFGLNLVQGVLLVPMYVHYIPQALLGGWLATGGLLVWLSMFDPGYSDVIMQRVGYHFGRGEWERVGGYAGISLLLGTLFGLFFVVLGGAVTPFLGWIIDLPAPELLELQKAFLLSVAGNALIIASFGWMAVNLGMLGSLGPGLGIIISNVVAIALIFGGLHAGWGVYSLGWAMVARGIISLGVAIVYFQWRRRREGYALRLSWERVHEVFRITGVFFIGKTAGQIAGNIQAMFVTILLGPAAAPVYVYTQRGIDLARTSVDRISMSLRPTVSNLHGAGRDTEMRSLVIRTWSGCFWIIGLLLAGFLALNRRFVVLWLGGDFYAGNTVNALFCAIAVVGNLSMTSYNILMGLGCIRQASIYQTVQAVASVGFMWVGGSVFGMKGLAAGAFTGLLIGCVGFYVPFMLRRIGATRADMLELAREMIAGWGCGLIVAWAISRVPVQGWTGFVELAALTVLAFSGLLSLVSKRFRRVARQLLFTRKWF